jgi:hypothetical protein
VVDLAAVEHRVAVTEGAAAVHRSQRPPLSAVGVSDRATRVEDHAVGIDDDRGDAALAHQPSDRRRWYCSTVGGLADRVLVQLAGGGGRGGDEHRDVGLQRPHRLTTTRHQRAEGFGREPVAATASSHVAASAGEMSIDSIHFVAAVALSSFMLRSGARGCDRVPTMALFHRATLTPTKPELIAEWAPTQPWCPADAPVEVIGAFRFDDPEGRVGMETHVVSAGGVLLQVPLTYRDAPVDGADAALVGEIEHSALGTRWVYDGLADPQFVVMLAAVAMTGQGESIGMVEVDGRWLIAPAGVRIQGGGWTQERVPVDGFEVQPDDGNTVVFHNDRFELTVFRRLVPGPRPAIGLTATWDGHPDPVVLAEVRER